MATIFVSAPASQLSAARQLAQACRRSLSGNRKLSHIACGPRVFVDTQQPALGTSYQSALFQAFSHGRLFLAVAASVQIGGRGLANPGLHRVILPAHAAADHAAADDVAILGTARQRSRRRARWRS